VRLSPYLRVGAISMKIAIIGGSPASRESIPFDDLTWDIWGLGIHYLDCPRINRVFEIHDYNPSEDPNHFNRLANSNIPLIVSNKFPHKGEHIQVFDYKKARKLMGGDHLTSSMAYMMAQAVMDGVDEIGIFGVDMSIDDNEYFYQRPTMYAWIGYAQAKGIKVTIPDISPLFKDPIVYGKESVEKGVFSENDFLEMAHIHQAKIEEYQGMIDNLQNQMTAHRGSVQTYQRLAKVARSVEAGLQVESISEHVSLQ